MGSVCGPWVFWKAQKKTLKKVLDKLRLILLKLISRSSMRLQTNI